MTSGIHLFSYFHILVCNFSLFLRCMECLVAVEISGGMNDFVI